MKCLNCNKDLVGRYQRKYCSKHCSNTAHKQPEKKCYCGNVLHTGKKYCSVTCQQRSIYEQYIERWLQGKEDGKKGKYQLSSHIRRWLFEKHQSKCQKCGWSTPNPVTGKVVLEVEHRDGNYKNNRPENLELICCNCHTLTPTYKALNKGNGRYQDGCFNPGNGK